MKISVENCSKSLGLLPWMVRLETNEDVEEEDVSRIE